MQSEAHGRLSRSATTTQGGTDRLRRFQLFTPPMLGQKPAACATLGDLDPYIDFLTCGQTGSSELLSWVPIYRAAIDIARRIYSMHFQAVSDLATMEFMVHSLRTLTEPLQHDTPGMHALVWSYFIAAASTQDSENQSYFARRLLQVYDKTHMHNIIVAIERLEEMWLQGQNGWTTRFPMMRPVLAI
jgi:hypothetical protein